MELQDEALRGKKNVGVARFELTISWSQTKRDTGLRYTPRPEQVPDLKAQITTKFMNSPHTRSTFLPVLEQTSPTSEFSFPSGLPDLAFIPTLGMILVMTRKIQIKLL